MTRTGSASARTKDFFALYTQGLTSDDFNRLFTRDARDAYRYFARGIDTTGLDRMPAHRRALARARLFFLAFSLRLTPARRALFGIALACAMLGLIRLFDGFKLYNVVAIAGFGRVGIPLPAFEGGALWLLTGFLFALLLVLLEVADRLSLKGDLNVAREIQLAMLPQGTYRAEGLEAVGRTQPANTVGGDFYDLQPLPDGRLGVVIGDVSGKGSPAALLMALLVAILRTLLEERLEPAQLVERLNVQVARQAPASRFITLFFAAYDPRSGRLTYVNAGHPPALIRRRSGTYERLSLGGVALGLFGSSTYDAGTAALEPGDLLILFSDGITDAENTAGEPLDEAGLCRVLDEHADHQPGAVVDAILTGVARHTGETRFMDDLTVLTLRRTPEPA